MAGRLLPSLGLVALGMGFGTALSAESTTYDHVGQVIEYQSGKPVEASVKAWPQSTRTGRDGGCSLYGDAPLDSRTSEGDGHFQLSISSDNHTYTVTYCAAGYVPRDDRDLPNDKDAGVLPMPATVWPIEMSDADTVAFNQAVKRRLILSLNEIAYLRNVNADAFQLAVSQVVETSQDHSGTIQALAELAANWNSSAK
jgi:hypothetical protein